MDVLKASLEEQRDLEAKLEAERERYNALVQDILAMKKEGFVSTPKPLPVAQQKASPSDEAITMRAGSNGLLRSHLTHWRNAQKAQGVEENVIAERILRWDDPDGRDD
jgi:hypothetical protein